MMRRWALILSECWAVFAVPLWWHQALPWASEDTVFVLSMVVFIVLGVCCFKGIK